MKKDVFLEIADGAISQTNDPFRAIEFMENKFSEIWKSEFTNLRKKIKQKVKKLNKEKNLQHEFHEIKGDYFIQILDSNHNGKYLDELYDFIKQYDKNNVFKIVIEKNEMEDEENKEKKYHDLLITIDIL